MIELSKEKMERALEEFLDRVFDLPEIESAKVRDVIISRENREISVRKAFEAGWHDCYSDVDLSVKVRLPKDGSVSPEAYMKRIDRFGITQESALGYCFVPENCMYRIILKNGMRYDFGFVFEYDDFFHLVLFQHFADDLESTVLADLNTVFIGNKQSVEFDLFADFRV